MSRNSAHAIAALAFRYEKNCGQRRDGEAKLGHRAVQRLDFPGVSDIATAVKRGVRIENLAPLAAEGHTDAVVVIYIRRKIHDHEAARAGIIALADPGEHIATGIIGHHPFEARLIAIELVQRRQRAIELVEIADQRLDAGVFLLLKKVPEER